MRLFKSKKVKEEEQEKKLKQQQENLEATTSKKIDIKIFRLLSDSLYAEARHIEAEEKPDNNGNFLAINEKAKFKEDLNFSIDRVYETMNYSLKLHNKDNKQKSEIIKAEIKKQEELVNELNADIEKNRDYNALDEELRLRQLKVLYQSLRREKKGNYMRLGKNGRRTYEFVSLDGILYPFFFGSYIFRVYPDLTIKKKIFNQENTIFRNEVNRLSANALTWTAVIALALGIIMMVAGGFMLYKSYAKTSEVALTANQGAITCSQTVANLQQQYGEIIEQHLNNKRKELENAKNINEQSPSTNQGQNIPIIPNNIVG